MASVTEPNVRRGGFSDLFEGDPKNWRQRLEVATGLMRELSRQTDPQGMFETFAARMRELYPTSRQVSLSRRGLDEPQFRVTRFSEWQSPVNPWKQAKKLPVHSGGLFAELIYGNEPVIIDELSVPEADPAAEYLAGQGSLMAIPHFDGGDGLNMVISLREEAHAFPPERLPAMVWMSNLFGRVTHGLVLAEKLRDALGEIDNELTHVSRIQRSLLPGEPPKVPNLGFATHYQTSQRAGGDYYDFFEVPGGKFGILIADVSGHGTPAAVVMAITHSLAHAYTGELDPPGKLLAYLNDQLTARYTAETGAFVTAFFAVYDPADGSLTYASAGHNPPRVVRCEDGSRYSLAKAQRLPLGIMPGETYPHETFRLIAGDQVIFYTDGITEATDPAGEMFGPDRLDTVLADCPVGADAMLKAVLDALERFTAGQPAADDRTLLVAKRT